MSDITTYHADSGRNGLNSNFPFPASGGTWRRYVTIPTNAPVRGAPLYLAQYLFTAGQHAGETHDMVIVAASDNTIYAYAEDELLGGTVNELWTQTTLGTASPRTGSNIPPPVGVCSTPVIDRAAGALYVMALVHQSGSDVFKIFALDLNTGDILDRATLNDGGASGRPTFDSTKQDQRGGLNLVNGWIYATFADFLAYDKDVYHGWVVACNQNNLSQQLFLPLTSTKAVGGGAWGPGGAAAAADGTLYVSTGNAMAADGSGNDLPGSYWSGLGGKHPGDVGDYFEGLARVQFTGGSSLAVSDWYQPSWARALNDADQDFGGSSPLALPTIGGRQLVITTAKDGNVYLLDGTLGGWGGELWSSVTNPGDPSSGALFAAESKCSPAHYQDPVSGDHLVYVVGSGNPGLVSFRVDLSGATPRLVQVWNAGMSFSDGPGSPFVMADPATQKALVWVVDGVDGTPAVLRAFDAVSGNPVFSSDAVPGNDVGQCPHFAPITVAGKSVFVGTNTGVVGYVNVPPSLSLILDQSTFGQDEVAVQLPGTAKFAAGWVKLDGFRPKDLGLNSGNLGNPPAGSIPVFAAPALDPSLPSAVSAAIGAMLQKPIFTPPVVPGDPSLPDAPQSFMFPFTIQFQGDGGFTAMSGANPTITSTLATLGASLSGLSDSAQIELTTGEDPRFVDVDPQHPTAFPAWLSFDLRFFKVVVPPGQTKSMFGAVMTDNAADAPGFIASVLGKLTNADFNGLAQDEDTTKLEFLPTDNSGNFVFNFAVARVRILAKSQTTAKTVRVFFRLFQAQNTASDFNPNTTYRFFSDGQSFGRKVPLLGVQNDQHGNPEYVTIPCFATTRVNVTTPASMTDQTDPPNARDLATSPGTEADYFFGCWLDINQPSQRFLPSSPPAGNLDGKWTGIPLFSLQEAIIAAPHQCLIAEIRFDDTPIPPGANSGNSDKLAQRNIAWLDGPNPGLAPSRRMPHPVQLRLTSKGSRNPDELMILWGSTPTSSEAELYLPALSAAEIISLANRRYADHLLRLVDANTIGCPTGGATFVPIPYGTGLAAGLLSINLPPGIHKGDSYTILVRQLVDARAGAPPPPPPPVQLQARIRRKATKAEAVAQAAIGLHRTIDWRRVAGAFQFNIVISTKERLLLSEERLLAVLRWMELKMPKTKRWYPVLVRYIDYVGGRVQGFGGDPGQITPSPTGSVPGFPSPHPAHHHHGREDDEEKFEGKIEGLCYDHFADFVGFMLETETGHAHRFFSRENAVRELALQAKIDRRRVRVVVEGHHRHIRWITIL